MMNKLVGRVLLAIAFLSFVLSVYLSSGVGVALVAATLYL